ncbi:signal recognition particle-docking protein FtsY [Natrinema saccharevitans]|uniref:Signal recognition particle receptor FtsY n=1 Tax=Natrinema saccharevitans TaxID=301967 RepID=A0A1S8B0C1_9EURY|nr:signal recognition particle-docking protein FtsY [Natrinema saccharevitans]OLZ42276.1 signal recognition particle-docking protein FtsY [Natrinema saccharevitans]
MFDNLKDKLGSFRDDAEEAAEENVEGVDEADLEADELAADDADTEPPEPDDPEPASSADAEATDTTADAETAAPAAAEVEPDAAVTSGSAPEATTEAAAADAAESAGQEPATDPDREADDAGSAPDEESAVDEEATADDEDDDGGRTGLGARARSLFSGSSDDSESDADETGSDDDPADAATPDEASAETPAADDPAAETAVDEGPVAGDADETADEADADEDDATADNGGTGFGAKAKSLVKGKFVIEEEDLEGPLHELEMALLSSDVEMGVAEEILDNIRDELVGETRTFTTSTGEVVEEALHNAIYDVISVGQFDFDERIAEADKPVTIVFTGVNGVGKTTSIAKLSRYFEERGYSTVMANGDTYRAGANEQIQEHADALDTKCISHEQGGDPAAVLYDAVEYAEANGVDVVLGDTAGRLHTDEGLMDQLEKIDRVVGPDMTLFVDEAVAGQDAVNRAREFNDAAEIDGAILTKADADSNGGAAISIAHVTGKPILFLGVGQGYDDLERFDPDQMLDRLLGDEE